MRAKNALILLLRVAASAGMLAFLLSRTSGFQLSRLVPAWDDHTAGWLVGALGLTLGGILLSAVRWQQVLTALGYPAHLGRLVSHYLAGQFVGNVLPSTIGGDVLRVFRLSRDAGREDRESSPRAFASVVLERLTGWVVLPLLTLTAFTINPGLRELGAATGVAVALAVGTLALLAAVLWLAAHPRLGRRLERATGWLRFIAAVHLGLDRFRHHPGQAMNVLVVALVYQLAVVAAALLAARALGIDVGPTAMLAFMPAVAIAQVLPISLSGLGVREGAFVLFLSPLGVAAEEAIALGLLVYVLTLAVSLLGAPAFAFGARPTRPA